MPDPDLLRDYHENGYLIVRAAASEALSSGQRACPLHHQSAFAFVGVDTARCRSHSLAPGSQPFWAVRSPAILEHVRSTTLCDTVRALLGPAAELQFTSTITKSPGKNQEVDWHQDAVYEKDDGKANAKDDRGQRLICWTALVDTYPENGGLSILPGSHRFGLVPHIPSPATSTIGSR